MNADELGGKGRCRKGAMTDLSLSAGVYAKREEMFIISGPGLAGPEGEAGLCSGSSLHGW
jgi:hypothetical protein